MHKTDLRRILGKPLGRAQAMQDPGAVECYAGPYDGALMQALKPGTRQSLKQGKPLGKIPGLSNTMHRPYGGAAKQDHGPVECYAASMACVRAP